MRLDGKEYELAAKNPRSCVGWDKCLGPGDAELYALITDLGEQAHLPVDDREAVLTALREGGLIRPCSVHPGHYLLNRDVFGDSHLDA